MMQFERFEDLARAYGGQIARWPEREREAALALTAAEPARTTAVLARERTLDRILDAAPALSPGAALVGRVLRAAENAGTGASRRLRRWLTGAGVGAALAVSAAAGVAAGALLVPPQWTAAIGSDPADEASALIADGSDQAGDGA